MNLIEQNEKLVEELESQLNNGKTFTLFNKIIDEITYIIRICVNQMIRIMNNKFLSDYRTELSNLYIKYYNKLKKHTMTSLVIPPFKEINKLAKNKINVDGINTRYTNYQTVFHNEACKSEEKNFYNNILELIEMGANISLKDKEGKTPLDYIKDNSIIDKIYSNMEQILNSKKISKHCYIPRIKRAMLEIELRKFEFLEKKSLEDYFNSVIDFVKYYKNKKFGKEEIENGLSNLIWHDETIYIRNQRENYFLKLKDRCISKINDAQQFF